MLIVAVRKFPQHCEDPCLIYTNMHLSLPLNSRNMNITDSRYLTGKHGCGSLLCYYLQLFIPYLASSQLISLQQERKNQNKHSGPSCPSSQHIVPARDPQSTSIYTQVQQPSHKYTSSSSCTGDCVVIAEGKHELLQLLTLPAICKWSKQENGALKLSAAKLGQRGFCLFASWELSCKLSSIKSWLLSSSRFALQEILPVKLFFFYY